MADLGDGQLALALLEGVDDRQARAREVMIIWVAVMASMRLAGEAMMGGAPVAAGRWRERCGYRPSTLSSAAFDRLSSEGAIIAIAFLPTPADAQGPQVHAEASRPAAWMLSMKTLEDHLSQYASYHRDPRNIASHFPASC